MSLRWILLAQVRFLFVISYISGPLIIPAIDAKGSTDMEVKRDGLASRKLSDDTKPASLGPKIPIDDNLGTKHDDVTSERLVDDNPGAKRDALKRLAKDNPSAKRDNVAYEQFVDDNPSTKHDCKTYIPSKQDHDFALQLSLSMSNFQYGLEFLATQIDGYTTDGDLRCGKFCLGLVEFKPELCLGSAEPLFEAA